MRDPGRIDRIIELLRTAWHLSPDLRLGQLIVNLLDRDRGACPGHHFPSCVHHVEDDIAERELKRWIAERAGKAQRTT